MKNNEKIINSLNSVDEKYIDEYISSKKAKIRYPRPRFAVVAAALAILVGVTAIAVPLMTKDDDPNISHTFDLTHKYDYVTDANGNRVLHIQNGYIGILEGAITPTNDPYMLAEYAKNATEIAIDWNGTLNSFLTDNSPNLLVFLGRKISSDSYCIEKEVTVTNPNMAVEYDVASGTTAYIEMPGSEPGASYTATKRICFTVSAIQIDEVLKKNNSSGYNAGDVIYVFERNIAFFEEDGKLVYAGDAIENSAVGSVETNSTSNQSVYLVSTNDSKRYIPNEVKESGLINVDAWSIVGIMSQEMFESYK